MILYLSKIKGKCKILIYYAEASSRSLDVPVPVTAIL